MDRADNVPIVDVLLPVRAPAPWLDQALDSIVGQQMSGWRLLLVMDGYSADVQNVIDELPPLTAKRVEVLPEGSGLVAALNHGLSVSHAQFIARLDADDVCRPERLSRQVAYMSEQANCVALGTGVEHSDEHGDVLGIRGPSKPGTLVGKLRWRCPIAHPTAMIRRESIVEVGGYRAVARHAEDFDLWLRLAAKGEIHAIPEVLLSYRLHGNQVTSGLKFPRVTRRAVLESRLALADARGESRLAARTRHATWQAVNRIKGR
jgi:glycosyltransferase involved in cell wall biosynthesis